MVSTLALVLPRRWRTRHQTQTALALAAPFVLDYLLVSGTRGDVRVPVIAVFVYLGLHSNFSVELGWRFSLPAWADFTAPLPSACISIFGGMVSALTLAYPSKTANFACGISSAIIVFSTTSFWLDTLPTKVALHWTSLSMTFLMIAAFSLGNSALALVGGSWALLALIAGRTVPETEYRFGDERE